MTVALGPDVRPDDESMLARLESALGPRYLAFVIGLALVLALLLLAAAAVTPSSAPAGRSRLWMLGLEPVILVYILAVHPFMRRRWKRAMQSLESLAPHADGTARPRRHSRPGEWVAVLVGALAGIALARRSPGADGWLWLYGEATSALTFALLATAVYGSVMRSRHLAAHSRAGLALNVFDGHLLTPFAQWGQSVSLVFVGGISLSLLFQSYESLRSVEGVTIYAVMILVAMTLFFMSMWTIHIALAKARDDELARVRHDLAAARGALARRRRGDAAAEAVHDAYLPAVVLGLYERQVLAAPTWPFNPAIAGRVLASTAAPLGVYLLKLAFGVGAGL